MAKMTLLEIVQDIRSDLVSDEVNSIDDTVESQSVANIVKTSYYSMLANRNWPHTRKLIQLEGLADLSRPNYLRMPETIKEMVEVEYDCIKLGATDRDYRTLKYKHPDEFLRMLSLRKSGDTNVKTVSDFSGVKLLVLTDKAPEYYTSFDDSHLVTDSYDSASDSTLTGSKTSCIAYITPVWNRSDTAIPDLPVEAFPALLSEAKSASFYSIKQMTNEKEEIKSGK